MGVTLLVGTALRLTGRHATNTLSRRDAYLLVTIVWIAFAAFGMLPFLIGGYIDHVTGCLLSRDDVGLDDNRGNRHR